MESEWYGVISFVQGSRVGWGRKQFFIYDGDGISEWYEISLFHGKVVSIFVSTDWS